MVITSKRTGIKYLTVEEAEKLARKIEMMLRKKGLNVRVQYHPTYLEVPIKQE